MKINWICFLFIFTFTCSSRENDHTSPKPAETSSQTQTAVASVPPSLCRKWNNTFHLRTTETGEILSVGAVFSDNENVYVYDQAENRVVILDTALALTDSVAFPSIGRNRYIGDDFVVLDDQFIFLNSVDHRLELFDRTTGKHVRNVPLPRNLFRKEKRRSRRIIDRLFLDGKTLYIGNSYHVLPFNPAMGKKAENAKTFSAPHQRQWLLFKKNRSMQRDRDGFAYDINLKKYRDATTHFPLSGKRHFTLGNRIYAVDAGKDSIRISVLTQP